MATSTEDRNIPEGFLVAPRVPQGLAAAVEGLTREVIRQRPEDIYVFAAHHFEKLLHLRESYGASRSLSVDERNLQALREMSEALRKRDAFREDRNPRDLVFQSGWSLNETAKVLERHRSIFGDEGRKISTEEVRQLASEREKEKIESFRRHRSLEKRTSGRREEDIISRNGPKLISQIPTLPGSTVKDIKSELRKNRISSRERRTLRETEGLKNRMEERERIEEEKKRVVEEKRKVVEEKKRIVEEKRRRFEKKSSRGLSMDRVTDYSVRKFSNTRSLEELQSPTYVEKVQEVIDETAPIIRERVEELKNSMNSKRVRSLEVERSSFSRDELRSSESKEDSESSGNLGSKDFNGVSRSRGKSRSREKSGSRDKGSRSRKDSGSRKKSGSRKDSGEKVRSGEMSSEKSRMKDSKEVKKSGWSVSKASEVETPNDSLEDVETLKSEVESIGSKNGLEMRLNETQTLLEGISSAFAAPMRRSSSAKDLRNRVPEASDVSFPVVRPFSSKNQSRSVSRSDSDNLVLPPISPEAPKSTKIKEDLVLPALSRVDGLNLDKEALVRGNEVENRDKEEEEARSEDKKEEVKIEGVEEEMRSGDVEKVAKSGEIEKVTENGDQEEEEKIVGQEEKLESENLEEKIKSVVNLKEGAEEGVKIKEEGKSSGGEEDMKRENELVKDQEKEEIDMERVLQVKNDDDKNNDEDDHQNKENDNVISKNNDKEEENVKEIDENDVKGEENGKKLDKNNVKDEENDKEVVKNNIKDEEIGKNMGGDKEKDKAYGGDNDQDIVELPLSPKELKMIEAEVEEVFRDSLNVTPEPSGTPSRPDSLESEEILGNGRSGLKEQLLEIENVEKNIESLLNPGDDQRDAEISIRGKLQELEDSGKRIEDILKESEKSENVEDKLKDLEEMERRIDSVFDAPGKLKGEKVLMDGNPDLKAEGGETSNVDEKENGEGSEVEKEMGLEEKILEGKEEERMEKKEGEETEAERDSSDNEEIDQFNPSSRKSIPYSFVLTEGSPCEIPDSVTTVIIPDRASTPDSDILEVEVEEGEVRSKMTPVNKIEDEEEESLNNSDVSNLNIFGETIEPDSGSSSLLDIDLISSIKSGHDLLIPHQDLDQIKEEDDKELDRIDQEESMSGILTGLGEKDLGQIKEEVQDQREGKIEEEIVNELEDVVGNKVREEVRDKMGEEIQNQTEEKDGDNLEKRIRNEMEEQVRDKLEEEVRNQTEENVQDTIEEGKRGLEEENIREKIKEEIRGKVEEEILDQMKEEDQMDKENKIKEDATEEEIRPGGKEEMELKIPEEGVEEKMQKEENIDEEELKVLHVMTSSLQEIQEGEEVLKGKEFFEDSSPEVQRITDSESTDETKETSITDGVQEGTEAVENSLEIEESTGRSIESTNEVKETTMTDQSNTSLSMDLGVPIVPELNLDSLQDLTISSFKMTDEGSAKKENEETESIFSTTEFSGKNEKFEEEEEGGEEGNLREGIREEKEEKEGIKGVVVENEKGEIKGGEEKVEEVKEGEAGVEKKEVVVKSKEEKVEEEEEGNDKEGDNKKEEEEQKEEKEEKEKRIAEEVKREGKGEKEEDKSSLSEEKVGKKGEKENEIEKKEETDSERKEKSGVKGSIEELKDQEVFEEMVKELVEIKEDLCVKAAAYVTTSGDENEATSEEIKDEEVCEIKDMVKKEETEVKKEDSKIQKEEIEVQSEEIEVKNEETGTQKEETEIRKEETEVQKEEIILLKEDTEIQKEEMVILKKDPEVQNEERVLRKEDTDLQKEDTEVQEDEIVLQKEDTEVQKEDTEVQKEEIIPHNEKIEDQKEEIKVDNGTEAKEELEIPKEEILGKEDEDRSASQCTTRRLSSANNNRSNEANSSNNLEIIEAMGEKSQNNENLKTEDVIKAEIVTNAIADDNLEEKKQYHIYVPDLHDSDDSFTDSSTFISAATKIQAGVRGFLIRRRLQSTQCRSSTLDSVPSIQESFVVESLLSPIEEVTQPAITTDYRQLNSRKRLKREDAIQRTTLSLENAFAEGGLQHTGEFHDCIPLPVFNLDNRQFRRKKVPGSAGGREEKERGSKKERRKGGDREGGGKSGGRDEEGKREDNGGGRGGRSKRGENQGAEGEDKKERKDHKREERDRECEKDDREEGENQGKREECNQRKEGGEKKIKDQEVKKDTGRKTEDKGGNKEEGMCKKEAGVENRGTIRYNGIGKNSGRGRENMRKESEDIRKERKSGGVRKEEEREVIKNYVGGGDTKRDKERGNIKKDKEGGGVKKETENEKERSGRNKEVQKNEKEGDCRNGGTTKCNGFGKSSGRSKEGLRKGSGERNSVRKEKREEYGEKGTGRGIVVKDREEEGLTKVNKRNDLKNEKKEIDSRKERKGEDFGSEQKCENLPLERKCEDLKSEQKWEDSRTERKCENLKKDQKEGSREENIKKEVKKNEEDFENKRRNHLEKGVLISDGSVEIKCNGLDKEMNKISSGKKVKSVTDHEKEKYQRDIGKEEVQWIKRNGFKIRGEEEHMEKNVRNGETEEKRISARNERKMEVNGPKNKERRQENEQEVPKNCQIGLENKEKMQKNGKINLEDEKKMQKDSKIGIEDEEEMQKGKIGLENKEEWENNCRIGLEDKEMSPEVEDYLPNEKSTSSPYSESENCYFQPGLDYFCHQGIYPSDLPNGFSQPPRAKNIFPKEPSFHLGFSPKLGPIVDFLFAKEDPMLQGNYLNFITSVEDNIIPVDGSKSNLGKEEVNLSDSSLENISIREPLALPGTPKRVIIEEITSLEEENLKCSISDTIFQEEKIMGSLTSKEEEEKRLEEFIFLEESLQEKEERINDGRVEEGEMKNEREERKEQEENGSGAKKWEEGRGITDESMKKNKEMRDTEEEERRKIKIDENEEESSKKGIVKDEVEMNVQGKRTKKFEYDKERINEYNKEEILLERSTDMASSKISDRGKDSESVEKYVKIKEESQENFPSDCERRETVSDKVPVLENEGEDNHVSKEVISSQKEEIFSLSDDLVASLPQEILSATNVNKDLSFLEDHSSFKDDFPNFDDSSLLPDASLSTLSFSMNIEDVLGLGSEDESCKEFRKPSSVSKFNSGDLGSSRDSQNSQHCLETVQSPITVMQMESKRLEERCKDRICETSFNGGKKIYKGCGREEVRGGVKEEIKRSGERKIKKFGESMGCSEEGVKVFGKEEKEESKRNAKAGIKGCGEEEIERNQKVEIRGCGEDKGSTEMKMRKNSGINIKEKKSEEMKEKASPRRNETGSSSGKSSEGKEI